MDHRIGSYLVLQAKIKELADNPRSSESDFLRLLVAGLIFQLHDLETKLKNRDTVVVDNGQ